MPALTFPAHPSDGPLIQVVVKPSVPFQRAIPAGQACPSFIATFLIDTGASHCLIDGDIVKHWGLVAKTPKLILSAGAPAASGFEIDLALLLFSGGPAQGWHYGALSVTTVPSHRFSGTKFQGLIGRDVLDQGVFTYDGPRKQVELSW